MKEFLEQLADEDAAEVFDAMNEVRDTGLSAARHLRGDVYEVRADGPGGSFRVLFSSEGAKGRILLALTALAKKTQRTPPGAIELAARRLADWRRRARR